VAKKNRVAVITGAAQGIGRRTAELLAERGYNVALSDLRSPAETMRAAAVHGVEAMELVGDIADETKVSGFAAVVGER
jgi:NAD(P)-dependent dehydrogenase (short-subunit alcohol dehydrogenase family)